MDHYAGNGASLGANVSTHFYPRVRWEMFFDYLWKAASVDTGG